MFKEENRVRNDGRERGVKRGSGETRGLDRC